MATAFSTANMKAEFPNIRLACSQLIEVLKTVGPDEVVDMDNALCRESLDVIGEALLCPKLAACPLAHWEFSPLKFHMLLYRSAGLECRADGLDQCSLSC